MTADIMQSNVSSSSVATETAAPAASESPRGRPRSSTEGKHMYFGKYVSSEGSKNLLTYQYNGSDLSLIYQYVLNPMNNFLIQFMPLWLAPNVITLAGLILVSISHAFLAYYCPFYEGEAPTWVYLMTAFNLFAYQTLDNLDGKQARRTGTSSPLGLLFDHGCDALNTTVTMLSLSSVIQLGPTWKTLVLNLMAQITFFWATWEEYYSGTLTLPIINGPTEGILAGVMLQLATAILGPSFWLQETFFTGVQNNTIVVVVLWAASFPTLFSNFFNAYRAIRARNDSMLIAMTRLLPHLILNYMALLWGLLSPSGIYATYPRRFIWVVALLDCKLVLHLMLAHLCGEEFHPFRKTLVPIFYVAAHSAYSVFSGLYDHINEGLLVQEFFFLAVCAYIHIVISVVYEVKTVLGIPVFTVPKEKQQHAKTT